MGDGHSRPPPVTDPRGSATRPYQLCRADQPEVEKGLPILPVRYAVEPNFLRRRSEYSETTTLEQFADKAASAHHYTLRTLRDGYVHVYLGAPGKWRIYSVDSRGYLSRLTNLDKPGQTSETSSLTPEDTDNDCNVAASFVYVSMRYSKVWIAFSETHWTRSVRSEMEKNPGARMQELDLSALAAAPDSHPHAFELTEKATKLSALVEEYADSKEVYDARTHHQAVVASTGTHAKREWDSAFGLHDRVGQAEGLGTFAKAYMDTVKASLKQVRKVPVVALMDPVGILKEINQTRLQFVESKQNYCEKVMRPLVVAQSINGLEKIIRESTFKQLEKKETEKGLPDVQTHVIPSANPYSFGTDPGYIYTTTRAERAKESADAVWNRLVARLRPGAKEQFEANYKKIIAWFDDWIHKCDVDWAMWADDQAWKKWFDDYDTQIEAKRAELLENKAACFAGGVVGVKSAEVWKKWLAAKPSDNENPVYRALFGDRKPLLSFLTPDGDGSLNKGDKLYDMLQDLINSDEFEQAVQATKAAAAEISLAITGAMSALGDDVAAASRDIVMRAQQAMLKLYQRVEVTIFKVQTTVGAYHRWLSEVAFKHKDAIGRQVEGLLRRGERVVKSAVVGGVMSIRNPKIRDQVIDVILWSFDTIDELKARLDTFATSADVTAKRTLGALEDAADDVLRTITVASATLNHQAARLLGAAEGQLALRASRLREFADDSLRRVLRFASGDVLLAAGAVFFEGWDIRGSLNDVKSKVGKEGNEAELALLSASVGFIGAVTELAGHTLKKLGVSLGKRLIRIGGVIAPFASLLDSVQAGFSASRAYSKGDHDAALGYAAASIFLAGGAAVGTYAAIIGSSSLIGPFGVALGLIVVGVVALWAAMNAEDTVAEIWMDRCYFGKGERSEKRWTDEQAIEELEHLNAIVLGLGAQVGFNDNYWGIPLLSGGFDTVEVQVTLGDYDENRSAYEWVLWVHHNDGSKIKTMGGRAGLPIEPIRAVLSPGRGKISVEEPSFKNFTSDARMKNTTLIVTASVDVRAEYFEEVSLEATYWLDRMDLLAVARVSIQEED